MCATDVPTVQVKGILTPALSRVEAYDGRQFSFTETENCGIIFFQRNNSSEGQHGQIDRLVLLP